MTSPPTPDLARRVTQGSGPTIIFLPGYASDMAGTKAVALDAWARATGRAFTRFDYRGCGASAGDFEAFGLADWRDDTLAMIDAAAPGPVVLVGSSMGGWLMLLAAIARPDRIVGLVGIAPAPDFTDWGFTVEEKLELLDQGRLVRTSPYDGAGMVTTRRFWSSGEALRLMFGTIAIDCPVRIVHGLKDADVPWSRSIRLVEMLRSADVQATFIKDGDHRLSRDADIATIIRAVEDVIARTC